MTVYQVRYSVFRACRGQQLLQMPGDFRSRIRAKVDRNALQVNVTKLSSSTNRFSFTKTADPHRRITYDRADILFLEVALGVRVLLLNTVPLCRRILI